MSGHNYDLSRNNLISDYSGAFPASRIFWSYIRPCLVRNAIHSVITIDLFMDYSMTHFSHFSPSFSCICHWLSSHLEGLAGCIVSIQMDLIIDFNFVATICHDYVKQETVVLSNRTCSAWHFFLYISTWNWIRNICIVFQNCLYAPYIFAKTDCYT